MDRASDFFSKPSLRGLFARAFSTDRIAKGKDTAVIGIQSAALRGPCRRGAKAGNLQRRSIKIISLRRETV